MDTRSQQQKVLELLKNAGNRGINTVDVRKFHYIVDVPTRIFELKEQGYLINKRLEKNGTATYFLFGKTEETEEKTEAAAKKIKHIEYIGNTARITWV